MSQHDQPEPEPDEPDGGVMVARIVIERRMYAGEHDQLDDLVDHVETDDGEGGDLRLVEALGMLRLAEDTLLHYADPYHQAPTHDDGDDDGEVS